MPTEYATSTATDKCREPCCLPPCDVFSIAGAIALLLFKELNKCQLETVLNILNLLTANLDAIVAQIDINAQEYPEPSI